PPSDVAQTTTYEGVTVPFIVRVETGYQDRDQYQIATLFQPGQPWAPWDPQSQWNHKLLIFHGAGCGVDHQTGSAPDTTGSNTAAYALGHGFTTMSTALDNAGHNCNIALEAESLMMAKERLVEQYGELRYTIGDGCSGVSDAERYDPQTNPGGARCDIQDAAINVFGPRPPADWSANEQALGRGFAGVPIDNVGVQYGLSALREGKIVPSQFVDINEK